MKTIYINSFNQYYEFVSVKFDIVGQMYVITTKNRMVYHYKRRKETPYTTQNYTMTIKIELKTPLVQTNIEKSEIDICEILKSNWTSILEYAFLKLNTEWIKFSMSEVMPDTYYYSEEGMISELDIDKTIFDKLMKYSPY